MAGKITDFKISMHGNNYSLYKQYFPKLVIGWYIFFSKFLPQDLEILSRDLKILFRSLEMGSLDLEIIILGSRDRKSGSRDRKSGSRNHHVEISRSPRDLNISTSYELSQDPEIMSRSWDWVKLLLQDLEILRWLSRDPDILSRDPKMIISRSRLPISRSRHPISRSRILSRHPEIKNDK